MACGIVAVGASWGGIHAIGILLSGLPADLTAPVVIAQHRGEEGPTRLAEALARRTALHVVEATDKDALSRGMQGLAVRIARAINRTASRKGGSRRGRRVELVARIPRPFIRSRARRAAISRTARSANFPRPSTRP